MRGYVLNWVLPGIETKDISGVAREDIQAINYADPGTEGLASVSLPELNSLPKVSESVGYFVTPTGIEPVLPT